MLTLLGALALLTIVVIATVAVIRGVSRPGFKIDTSKPPALIGAWELKGEDYDQRLVFHPDGTFTHVLTGSPQRSFKGTWTFDGTTLARNDASRPDPADALICKVTSLTHRKMTLDGQVTYSRTG